MKIIGKSGTAVATAAFALAISGGAAMLPSAAVAGEEAKVQCMGVNSCKGHSDCATAASACKGQNSCKGQGFLSMTKAECDEKGGTVES